MGKGDIIVGYYTDRVLKYYDMEADQYSGNSHNVGDEGEDLRSYNCYHDMAFGPDNLLYIGVVRPDDVRSIEKYDVSKEGGVAYVGEFVAETPGLACGLVFDAQGNLWIAAESNVIRAYDLSGTAVVAIDAPGTVGSFGILKGIAFDSEGNLYVCDETHGILRYDGVNWTVFISGIDTPHDIVFNAVGNAFVSDQSNGQILEYDSNGIYVRTIATGLNQVRYLDIDDDGNIYAAVIFSNYILKIAPGGQTTQLFSGSGNWPISVKVTPTILGPEDCDDLWAYGWEWASDLSEDCTIDILDLVIWTESWLDDEGPNPADMTGDNNVKLDDFSVLANDWLQEYNPNNISIVYYVDPDGNDLWSGRMQVANAEQTDGPLASLRGARDAIRELTAQNGVTRPIEVVFAEGVYSISNPVYFTSLDSGISGCPITYRTEYSANVLISGGVELTNWVEGEGTAQGTIWTTYIDSVEQGEWYFRDLYLDNYRLTRARYPNDGYMTVLAVNGDQTQISLDEVASGDNMAGKQIEFVAHHAWSTSREIVASSAGNTLYFTTPAGADYDYTRTKVGDNAYLEHGLEFLDMPMEWYLDKDTGVLTIMLPNGENPNNKVVTAPQIKTLIDFDDVEYLRFEGMCFGFTGYDMPSIGYSGQQACRYKDDGLVFYTLPAMLEFVDSSHISLEGVRLGHAGGNGIAFGAGSDDNTIIGCEVFDIAGNGILIGWEGETTTGQGDWPNSDDAPFRNMISHNYIHHYGRVFTGGVGVWAGYTDSTTIANNHVCFAGYSGISCGWGWTSDPTTIRNTQITNNKVHNVMQILSDGAGIYVMSYHPQSLIMGNVICDIQKDTWCTHNHHQSGFQFDEGSSVFYLVNNVVYNIPDMPFYSFTLCGYDLSYGTNYFDVDLNTFYYAAGVENDVIFAPSNPPGEVINIESSAGINDFYHWLYDYQPIIHAETAL